MRSGCVAWVGCSENGLVSFFFESGLGLGFMIIFNRVLLKV